MRSSLRLGSSELMASDGCTSGSSFAGFSLALSVPWIDDADRVFAQLSKGGQVTDQSTSQACQPCAVGRV